jgi:hypothetical protein
MTTAFADGVDMENSRPLVQLQRRAPPALLVAALACNRCILAAPGFVGGRRKG